MNRNYFSKVLLIGLILVWSIYEIYPPNARDLVQLFRERAVNRDTNFVAIVERAQALQKVRPDRPYADLQEAIGTNDITRYFQFPDAKNEANPNTYVLNRLQREAAGRIGLGIYLKGGTSFLLRMDTNRLEHASDVSTALSQAVEVLRKRVDKFGVAEPVIQPAGTDRILIQLPGLSESEKTNTIIQLKKPAFLEFRLVHPQSDDLVKEDMVEPGYEILRRTQTQRDGREIVEAVRTTKRPEMIGGVKSATVTRGTMGGPKISFTLDSEGATKFGEITKQNVDHRLAIVLDGQLYSAPVIRSAILTGTGQITGNFDQKEAFELA